MRRVVLVALFGVAASFAPVWAVSQTQYGRLEANVVFEMRAGKWQAAYADLKTLHAWAPDVETVSYDAACVAVKLGSTEEAFEWLDRAIASGYASPDRAAAEAALAPLRRDARWEPALQRIRANRDAEARMMLVRRPDLDAANVPSFRSFKKLDAFYDHRHEDLHRDSWTMSRRTTGEKALSLVDERIAADRRYIAEHPAAADRDAAAWDAVSSRVGLRQPYRLREQWGDAGAQTVEELDAFLVEYPSSPRRAEARMHRAFAVFHVRADGGTPARPWAESDLEALVMSLGSVATEFRGTTIGGIARARQLIVANVAEVESVTPEMVAMRKELQTTYARNPDVQGLVATSGRGATMRIDGFDEFRGTDLGGRAWSVESFKGKVTLVDFWATWCGPCLEELPTMRRIWDELAPSGLQIVGVSLDQGSRKDLETWLVEREVAWPQIYDGRGFETSLAKEFGVRSIPFAVVIGPDAKVAAADLRGEELMDRVRELVAGAGK